MKKVISYRQKLIALARIYKVDKILDINQKLTTYEVELELLKNKVPIPSRRGYFSHKVINEILKPSYVSIKEKLSKFYSLNKTLSIINILKKNFKIIFNDINIYSKIKLFISFNLNKILKITYDKINSYSTFIVSNINNFFKTLIKTIINSLNDLYHFKFDEKSINKFLLRGAYSFLLVMFVTSVFHIKNLMNDVDDLKTTLDIKSNKEEIIKLPDIVKKNKSKNSEKKKEVLKKPYDPETDYVLNTQTVLNLFEDLEYDLDQVRNRKVVKPIYFTRLPKDLGTIKSIKEKKETFLRILLPLIVAENKKIKDDREYLLKILKDNESEESKKWLNIKFKAYKVSDRNITELIKKIDIIPISIALAQAAKESGWGTSRFALEGNAIYGQWTWNGDGIEPLEKTKGQNHKILKFPLLRASVKAYINNLNAHAGYKNFRTKRSELRAQNKKIAGLELIHELKNYAQNGEVYTEILEKIIKQNDLDELENVKIDDFKKNKQLKL